jgi:hypothetical protein
MIGRRAYEDRVQGKSRITPPSARQTIHPCRYTPIPHHPRWKTKPTFTNPCFPPRRVGPWRALPHLPVNLYRYKPRDPAFRETRRPYPRNILGPQHTQTQSRTATDQQRKILKKSPAEEKQW